MSEFWKVRALWTALIVVDIALWALIIWALEGLLS
jgi:hypothetical protein